MITYFAAHCQTVCFFRFWFLFFTAKQLPVDPLAIAFQAFLAMVVLPTPLTFRPVVDLTHTSVTMPRGHASEVFFSFSDIAVTLPIARVASLRVPIILILLIFPLLLLLLLNIVIDGVPLLLLLVRPQFVLGFQHHGGSSSLLHQGRCFGFRQRLFLVSQLSVIFLPGCDIMARFAGFVIDLQHNLCVPSRKQASLQHNIPITEAEGKLHEAE
mmetsp:Transcript_67595/g.147194  ORF Transcript_67595/g.147194 Transcript_67595/m.147194 type:complete len:213 (+) Transcript_67595:509-1147(+)